MYSWALIYISLLVHWVSLSSAQLIRASSALRLWSRVIVSVQARLGKDWLPDKGSFSSAYWIKRWLGIWKTLWISLSPSKRENSYKFKTLYLYLAMATPLPTKLLLYEMQKCISPQSSFSQWSKWTSCLPLIVSQHADSFGFYLSRYTYICLWDHHI